MEKRSKKNELLRKILAGFYKGSTVQERKKQEKEILEGMRNSTFYRGRPRMRSELKKGKSRKDKENFRKQEEALGITALV